MGSLSIVTNEQGAITEEQSFDAWGRRRNPQTWTYNNVPASYKFYRGYMGHEQLDQFGLINMNGRMYDPSVGRFLSADNVIQALDFTKNYNRYYVPWLAQICNTCFSVSGVFNPGLLRPLNTRS